MGDVARDWSHKYIVRWYFGQEKIWISADKTSTAIRDMPKEYALNCLAMLERFRDPIEEHLDVDLEDTELYRGMRSRALEAV